MDMSMRLCVSDDEEDEHSLQLQHGIRPAFLAPVRACITRCLPVSVFSSTAQDGHLLQREGTPTCRFASARRKSNNQQVYEACGDSSTHANDSTNAANAVIHLMQTHRKPNFDALLPTKEDPLATQSATSTDPLLTKQGDETGDVFATVPDSLRCFSSAPAPISPSNANFKNINVGLKEIAIFYPGQQIHSSRNSPKDNLWIRINLYPILCVRCHLCNASPYTTIIYPKNCRFSPPLWPFDPGIHTLHRSPSSHRPFAPDKDANHMDSTYVMLLSFLEGGVYIKNKVQRKKWKFKDRTLPPKYSPDPADEPFHQRFAECRMKN
ncbi:hypothetical protein KP509_15G017800 [Ceratopteris richardii]|uniref:Uncharacterized protein n=1 Tax=Ceratopteris richardii TaxID=49495 RepID=A0A8T2T3E6_CERRI|nr:hypothetical protein KP509_15G017800 [Ceratopteris richardii]